jgi:hypothetical protein
VAERCHCRVPFCRRTVGGNMTPADPWLCCNHWRLVPRWMKRRRTTLARLWRKAGGTNGATWANTPPKARQALRLYWRWWDRMEAVAKERAAGITA